MTKGIKAVPYETIIQDCLVCYGVLNKSNSNYFNMRTIKRMAEREGYTIPKGRGARCIKVLEDAGVLYRDSRQQNHFFSIKKRVSEEELMVLITKGFLEPAISWFKNGNSPRWKDKLPPVVRDNLDIFLRQGYFLMEENRYVVNSEKISQLEQECNQYLISAEDLLGDQEETSIDMVTNK